MSDLSSLLPASALAYLLMFIAAAVLFVLLWGSNRFREERRNHAHPLSVAMIIERAKLFQLRKTAQRLTLFDPNNAALLEQEVRRCAAVLALNCGQHYLMSPRMELAWQCLVSENQEYAGLCVSLLGTGGSFTQIRVPRIAGWDVTAAKDKFLVDYVAAFGVDPDPAIWECNPTAPNAFEGVDLLIFGDLGRYTKVLQKDGEFVAFSHGSSMER